MSLWIGGTIALILFLSGCSSLAPYAGYTHISDPRIADTPFDLVCGGVKGKKIVEVTFGACKDLHFGEYLKVDFEYVWRDGPY